MSEIVELSLVVTKASFDKAEPDKNKKRRILMTNSDTAPDLYDESMSVELFQDFCRRIESNEPIPEQFKSVICEDSWCGGMPYISIAHYPAGKNGKNVPGMPESVYVDGERLKSKAYLYDNPLGRNLFDALCDDIEKRSKGTDNPNPVRVSIGFLDLEHVHIFEGKTITFTRTELGQKCPLCKDGTGSKIYKKGYLVHLAATRVPVNPRTSMDLEEKSMGEIITKKDDAASIIGDDLAKELEAKSLAEDVLVVKADGTDQPIDDGMQNVPQPTPFASCYDPNTDSFSQDCIDASMRGFMAAIRNEMNTVKSDAVDRLTDEVAKSLERLQAKPVVEESMEPKNDSKQEEEEVKETEKETAEEEKSVASPLDAAYESLKSLLGTKPTSDQVQAAFNALGEAVEKSYVPETPAPAPTDLAAIVRSAVEEIVTPLRVELATVKAAVSGMSAGVPSQDVMKRNAQLHPVSRALTLTPEELTKKSGTSGRKLSQIEMLARKSTGASLE